MVISEKQHEANRRNAQHSTGPVTPEGRAAVRLNALTYGLRARSTLITGENPEEYKQLWAELMDEWQPQTRTERFCLEQMATAQWLLARTATGESSVYEDRELLAEQQFALLREADRQRVSLQRSFTAGLHELQDLQDRRARRAQTAPIAQKAKAAPARAPVYVTLPDGEIHSGFGAATTTDTR